MRIGRFNVLSFFGQICRTTMAGYTFFHGQSFRFFGLSMAFYAIDIRQLMHVASRQFTRQAEIILIVTSPARFKIHGFGVGMLVGQHFLLDMAGGAISSLGFGLYQFRGRPKKLAKYKNYQDAE